MINIFHFSLSDSILDIVYFFVLAYLTEYFTNLMLLFNDYLGRRTLQR
tara:strand:+ start:217 stop:360 length:144 start_codon:yes stop_codon:yes gene_type:complete